MSGFRGTGHSGGQVKYAFRSDGKESLHFTWFPNLQNGTLPSFIGVWEEYGDGVVDPNLMIRAYPDQTVSITEGDDDGLFLSVKLRSAEEIRELASFFEKVNVNHLKQKPWVTKTLSAIIEGAYLTVDTQEGYRLLPILDSSSLSEFPDLLSFVDHSFDLDSEFDIMTSKHPWFSMNPEWEQRLSEKLVVPQSTDIAFKMYGEKRVDLMGRHLFEPDSDHGWNPMLVLRLNSGTSLMFICDYLAHAKESAAISNVMFSKWRDLLPVLKSFSLPIPSNKLDQIAHSIELRHTREEYLSKINALITEREPFASIIPLYQKRHASVDLIHSDLLDEIHAITNPMPFFIEYPYKRFRRCDRLQKIDHGMGLLNLLIKLPLFLVAEELEATGSDTATEILAPLMEKPATDGTLLDMRRKLNAKIRNTGIRFSVFQGLANILDPSPELNELLTARNRVVHPPNESAPFLNLLDQCAPRIIETLRSALKDVDFIIPQASKFSDKKRHIEATFVMGSDPDFEKKSFSTTASFESFPTETLVAYNRNSNRTVCLTHWLKHEQVEAQIIDLGIFDRMRSGKPIFTFLRRAL